MAALTNIEAVIRRWRREGVRLLPPRGEPGVVAALGRTGRAFSRDLVALYTATGGMPDGEVEGNTLCLWSLERLVEENLKSGRPLLLFMDFLINSFCYGLRRESAEVSSVHLELFGDGPPTLVAGALDEFFGLYLSDPSRLYT